MITDLFKNILIPVDFGENTEAAIKQAIELANESVLNIHLLHIIRQRHFWEKATTGIDEIAIHNGSIFCPGETLKKMQEWKHAIEETVPAINVIIHIDEGNVYDGIVTAAKNIMPQLIIMGKKSHHKLMSFYKPTCPDELARSTNCPVLNVAKNSINAKIKTIVVPVRNFIPGRKIEFIVFFAKMFRAKIQLVALQNKMSEAGNVKKALLDTYMLLRTVLNSPIEYHLLKDHNYPRAVLKFAESVIADMILVNPEVETKMSFFTGKNINEAMRPGSKLKILYVQPYPAGLYQNKIPEIL